MEALGCLGLIVYAVLLVVLSAAVRGFVIMTLWNWFAVSALGVPVLELWPAYGMALLASAFLLGLSTQNDDKKKNEGLTELLVMGIVKVTVPGLVILAMGWIVYQLI